MSLIELKKISKSFGKVKANDNISLTIENNSVHCLIGENGAGKTTLMKILFGVYKPDSGEIFINGKQVIFKSSLDAIKLKIGMLHQHFMLIDNFTVLENVILGAETSRGYKLDFKNAERRINEIIRNYNLQLNPHDYVDELSIGAKQKVELLKLLYRDSEILIFDEPTAVLTPVELKDFFNILNNFKRDGKTIILITHKLNEVKDISDKVSVLRKGKLVYETDKDNLDISELGKQIIGEVNDIDTIEKIEFSISKKEELLIAENINLIENSIKKLNNLNFSLKRFNIFGLCGVEGNGQNELVEVLMGIKKKYTGKISPENLNISLVPDDRIKKGMIAEMSVAENYFLRKRDTKVAFRKKLKEFEEDIVNQFLVRIPYRFCPMKYLSGGNQQKAIVGREILLNNDILIFSHPTRGVDIRAREKIHFEILMQRMRAKAILLISSDMDELITLSDELAVMYKGMFLKVFSEKDLRSELELNRTAFLERIGELMIGIVK